MGHQNSLENRRFCPADTRNPRDAVPQQAGTWLFRVRLHHA